MATDTLPIVDRQSGGTGLPPVRSGGGWGGGDGDHSFRGRSQAVALRTYRFGVILAMGSIAMVFIAFTSALIVRRGVTLDWRPTDFPRLFWLNSAVLVASSITVESARKALKLGIVEAFRRWWWITTALGIAFLVGQYLAWRQLMDAGVYLSSNPSSSFLYLLTGAHGVHLVGGVVALLVIALRRSVSR